MAKRVADQLGIRFSTSVNKHGYEWVYTDMERQRLRLAPKGHYVWDGTASMAYRTDTGYVMVQFGQRESQSAMNAFKRLGDDLRPLEKIIREAGINGAPWPKEAVDGFADKVLAFANQYGLLQGEGKPLTIDEWRREILDFRDIWDIGEAIRTSDFRETEKRFHENDGILWYVTGNTNFSVTTREAANLLQKGASDRARFVFAKWMNRKLAGGLSMVSSVSDGALPIVTPLELRHALYAKLMIKTEKYEQQIRGVNCLECDRPISGKRRTRKYCDDRCRARHHNRRRAAEKHAS